jgi:hypothetical protein
MKWYNYSIELDRQRQFMASMTTTAQNILQSFDALPQSEQAEVAAEIMRRASTWEEPTLSDDALTAVAADIFRQLDAGESSNENISTR